jgi:hypothetical protein
MWHSAIVVSITDEILDSIFDFCSATFCYGPIIEAITSVVDMLKGVQ